MSFKVVRNDITKMEVDAIVNPTNRYLKGSSSIDGTIHKVGGKQLDEECRRLNGCEIGDAKVTNAYNLPCKYIIHTVGPIWRGGNNDEEKLLFSCYKRALDCAIELGISSIAFPIISSGHFSFPKNMAIDIACKALTELTPDNIIAYLVIYDIESLELSERTQAFSIKHMTELKENDMPIINVSLPYNLEKEEEKFQLKMSEYNEEYFTVIKKIQSEIIRQICLRSIYWDLNSPLELKKIIIELEKLKKKSSDSFECIINEANELVKEIENINVLQSKSLSYQTEDSFSKVLIEMIDKKGLSDPDVYRSANITKQTFSNIRCDNKYHPKKKVAISLALALNLNLEETQKLLATAGYTLSNSITEDVIIKNCIIQGEYDVMRVNLLLMKHLGHGL